MVVIYAEKSSLATDIASALHAGKRIPLKDEPTVGYWQFTYKGEQAVLCHGVGHLAQLIPAKMYDPKYEKWDLSVYPCIPDNFRVAPIGKTLKCLQLVKSILDKADWLICATDSDREGDLIFAYVCDVCKCSKPYKRLWLNKDLQGDTIRTAFNELKAPSEPLTPQSSESSANLQLAGRARSITDWLVGINLSVAATKKYGNSATDSKLLTLGRVQTPTLNMVVERERAIQNHKKTPFWKLTATFSTSSGDFEANYEKGNFTAQSEADAALTECNGNNGIVSSIETKHKAEAAPLLFNTTQLLIAVSKKLDWDAAKTTEVLQQLYEKKYVSYPRTKAEHLTEAMKSEVKQTIEKLFKLKEYEAYAVEPMAEFTNRHFDDAKVASHTAIIASKSVPDSLDALDSDEKQLYDIIARSLIKIAYPKAEYDDTTVKITVKEHIFKASGKVITNSGWYAVDGKADSKSLPPLSEGQEIKGIYKLTEGVTEPPKRYTEAELLAAMELAGQKLEDEEARTLMKLQGMGLGTDATREPTLNELYRKEYIARKGKSIIPTELGTYIIDTLPVNELKSAEYTGALEKELNDIALGKADYNEYISRIKAKTSEWFKIIADSETKTFTSTKDEQLKCPLCGKPVRTLDWGYSCSGYKEGCKFSINKKIADKTITESQAIALCQKGKTTLIKGFKSKSGNTFDAYLIYNKADNKISFQFPEKKNDSKSSRK